MIVQAIAYGIGTAVLLSALTFVMGGGLLTAAAAYVAGGTLGMTLPLLATTRPTQRPVAMSRRAAHRGLA